MRELNFTGPRVAPEGIVFAAQHAPDGRHLQFVVTRQALGELAGREPRLSQMMASWQRWRPHILEAAGRIAQECEALPAEPLCIPAQRILEAHLNPTRH